MDSQSRSQQAALKRLKIGHLSVNSLWEGILKKDKVALGQAVSLIESNSPKHRKIAEELIQKAIQYNKNLSFKIGVTGVPGVGKSTFINVYTDMLIRQNHSVAILTVDPSSQQSGGSILGDKTRMKDIHSLPNVFIRPSPSGKQLGGVANKTREVILLCEAAGFDRILVETVGVGQSEISVADMTDLFLLLMLPGAGDELQGIKRGIMELADILIVHKADGDNALKAKTASIEYKRALKMFPPSDSSWTPVVLTASSEPVSGLEEVHHQIEAYFKHTIANGYLLVNREKQQDIWFHECLENEFFQFVQTQTGDLYQKLLQDIREQKITPQTAARKVIESIYLHDKK